MYPSQRERLGHSTRLGRALVPHLKRSKKLRRSRLVAAEAAEAWRPVWGEQQTNPLPGQLLLEIPNNRWLEAGACLEMIEDNIVAGNLKIHSYPNVFLW